MNSTTSNDTVVTRSVRTFSVAMPGNFEDAVASFESKAPPLDGETFAREVRRAGSWDEITQWTTSRAPHGFLIYWKNDVRGLMGRAGDTHQAIAYLLGNHITAEKMFRIDPRVMIYAPLRVEISQVEGGAVMFTADVPSDMFGGYGSDEILAVAQGLDTALAALLVELGAVPPGFLAARTRVADPADLSGAAADKAQALESIVADAEPSFGWVLRQLRWALDGLAEAEPLAEREKERDEDF